ncbi:SRRM2 protein homolog rsr-2-like [Ambystoma mexicanum]|uniref:SRRM2 protein homolog rsr-2-like n=1 Tax=Ambystoma mexicanum TaxID=8296 RepID=UPI0037E91FEE
MTDKLEVFQFKKTSVSNSSQTEQIEYKETRHEDEQIATTAEINWRSSSIKDKIDTNLGETKKGLKEDQKENQSTRVQPENNHQLQRKKIAKNSSTQKEQLSTKGSTAQDKQRMEKNANLFMSKWISGMDQKIKVIESELQETKMKATHKLVEESSLDLSDLSTYSIENWKERKVSFAEDNSSRTEHGDKYKQKQTKAPEKEKNKIDDLNYRRSRITPERKLLFRLANIKINKTKHESPKDRPTQSSKEKHEGERLENTPNSGTHHKQYHQHNQRARQNKPETSPYRKKSDIADKRNNNQRREKTSPSDRHSERRTRSNRRHSDYSIQPNPTRTSAIFTHKSNSSRTLKLEKSDKKGEKILLNRRETMRLLQKVHKEDQIRSRDLNIVEFAHKARTDSIFLHITSQTVKKLLLSVAGDLVKRGYTLRETTAEERGYRRDDSHKTRERRNYETNEKEIRKTTQITPVTERLTRTKRKFNSISEIDHRKEEDKRRKSRELLDQSDSKMKSDKERVKTREKLFSQDSWTHNDTKSQRTSPRKPKGPFLSQITREKEKRTIRENTSMQNQTKEAEKNPNKWAWIPSALTRYVRK